MANLTWTFVCNLHGLGKVTAHPDRRQTDDRQTDRQTDDGLKAYGLSHLDKPVRMRIKNYYYNEGGKEGGKRGGRTGRK